MQKIVQRTSRYRSLCNDILQFPGYLTFSTAANFFIRSKHASKHSTFYALDGVLFIL